MSQSRYDQFNWISILCLCIAISSLAMSCTGGKPDAIGDPIRFPRMIVDEIGFEIKQKIKPERIASVDLMSDEILLDLVGSERMVIVTTRAEEPSISNVVEKAMQVANRITMEPEKLIEERPDITFMPSWTGPFAVTKLRAKGVPVYYSDPPTGIEEIKAKITGFAFIVGEPEKGEELITWMDEILEEVSEKVAGIAESDRLSVMFYKSVELRALGKNTIWDDVVAHAGLINAVKDMEADKYGEVYTTWEDIKGLDPDIILLPGRVLDDPVKGRSYFDEVMANPELKNLSAFQNQQVYMANESHFSTKSHYIALGVRDLAILAYPELFE